MQTISGNITDITNRNIFYGTINYDNTRIISIEKTSNEKSGEPYLLPGFIDAHIHIESSMLVPSKFAELAVIHGTTGTISDPHEIANVCGMEGVVYMIENGKTVPFKFHFGAPSCVPATIFETAGAELNAADVEKLMASPDIYYLSEMMNFPGVLFDDAEVLKKIAAAKKIGKPVDGHAPGLTGKDAEKYIHAGISTDHECVSEEEALFKLQHGMKILIREGSAAKNFEALISLLDEHYEHMMFCSDDKHPDSLLEGHINELCRRAVERNIDVFKVLQAACINPVEHYKMKNGKLRVDDPADFIVVKDLKEFKVIQTYIDGVLVAENGKSLIKSGEVTTINTFNCSQKNKDNFKIAATAGKKYPVIVAEDGQLITGKEMLELSVVAGYAETDTAEDLVKIVVVNRYQEAKPAIAFVKNTGLKYGALASTVAHDSHNIVAIGTSDEDISRAVNLLIESQGGISAVFEKQEELLPLPVGGLMSAKDGYSTAADYTRIDQFVKNELRTTLSSPFMTLSFLALPVIPHLKLTDKGLFDVDAFAFVES